jgi:hypothetical protein
MGTSTTYDGLSLLPADVIQESQCFPFENVVFALQVAIIALHCWHKTSSRLISLCKIAIPKLISKIFRIKLRMAIISLFL